MGLLEAEFDPLNNGSVITDSNTLKKSSYAKKFCLRLERILSEAGFESSRYLIRPAFNSLICRGSKSDWKKTMNMRCNHSRTPDLKSVTQYVSVQTTAKERK